MQSHLLALCLHPLPVPVKPGLQIILIQRQPAGPTPHIPTIGTSRHTPKPNGNGFRPTVLLLVANRNSWPGLASTLQWRYAVARPIRQPKTCHRYKRNTRSR
ncbi:hypothetical protein MSEO_37340 [Mycobacterium seoulense]|uniref:Uncharacterized protein n=1 Tax=Mycobacterium seoulense TaxID=386911 RepID=A0A7I7P3A5_9MYCO|nr:hypothetical protein MSEO_37340 [Mycobacterium seoulense]